MRHYRRRLPHIDAPGAAVFVTFRLHGSLPPERIFHREELTSGQAFLAMDRLLDTARTGPMFLRPNQIAQVVLNKLHDLAAGGLCTMHACVLMPNHVHVLWKPAISFPELMRKVKGATAVAANRVLGRSGERFWQEEYFDRVVQDRWEFERIRRYIESNPVAAGLVSQPEEWPWSSAGAGLKPCAG